MKSPIGTLAPALLCAALLHGALLAPAAPAAVPHLISYQGKLVDATGAPVPNGDYSVTFRIYDAPAGGTLLWDEAQTVTVTSGLLTALLGSLTPLNLPFDQGYYLGVQVAGDAEMTPRQRLASAGTSYRAETAELALNADLLDGRNSSEFVRSTGPDSVRGSGAVPALYVTNTSGGTALLAEGYGATDASTYAVSGYAANTSTGITYGGYFQASSFGEGVPYGVIGFGTGSEAAPTYGSLSYGLNSGPGGAVGGRFVGTGDGTGINYGVYSEATGTYPAPTYGAYGYAENLSTGSAFGGLFQASSAGGGYHYGLYGLSSSWTSLPSYGSYSFADNLSTGDAYGGYFYVPYSGSGIHYGTYAESYGASSSTTFGTVSYAQNYTGDAYGGYFATASAGIGYHYGLYGLGAGETASPAYGTYGLAYNWATGDAYAGYFYAPWYGTGTHYGVYGVEEAGGSGAAVYASGDLIASGGKYGVVKTSRGHSLLSAMESPEVWFEDFGQGRLEKGRAHIELDPLFLETVTISTDHPLKVFVQLTSGEPLPVVVEKGLTGFEVRAVDLSSAATFDYRVVAKRQGYEGERLRVTDAGSDDPHLYPELRAGIERRQEEESRRREIERESHRHEQERMASERRPLKEEPPPELAPAPRTRE